MSLRGLSCGWLLISISLAAAIKHDEQVVIFPTVGWQSKEGQGWELEVHGWIYESERRRMTLAMLRAALGVDEDSGPNAKMIFEERARAFLVDNERGKKVSILLGGKQFKLDASGDNGHFTGKVTLSHKEVERFHDVSTATITVDAVVSKNDPRSFKGDVHLLNPIGLSVISDIDDTIKISEVRDRKALLQNTFMKPFLPVPGMAEVYRTWLADSGAQFHYVSASPWQLYQPLSQFVRTNGLPAGTFHMKLFRLKDESFFDLQASPEDHKLGIIEPLLKRFPRRQFVLVGDSGERDPEIYGILARSHPRQVKRVFIRDITDEGSETARYGNAFRDVPLEVWHVFRHPVEIRHLVRGRD